MSTFSQLKDVVKLVKKLIDLTKGGEISWLGYHGDRSDIYSRDPYETTYQDVSVVVSNTELMIGDTTVFLASEVVSHKEEKEANNSLRELQHLVSEIISKHERLLKEEKLNKAREILAKLAN